MFYDMSMDGWPRFVHHHPERSGMERARARESFVSEMMTSSCLLLSLAPAPAPGPSSSFFFVEDIVVELNVNS